MFDEKEFRKALELRDKNVRIDFVCQYKWERDYFERQYKKSNKALDVVLTLAINENEECKTLSKEEKQKIKEHIKALGFELVELGGEDES